MKAEVSPFDAIRYGTRLCAHAANSTMHRTNAANTATSNTASIMLAPIESRLPLEVLICRGQGTFPAIFHDRDCEALGLNAKSLCGAISRIGGTRGHRILIQSYSGLGGDSTGRGNSTQ
jgi:hypothetical protein